MAKTGWTLAALCVVGLSAPLVGCGGDETYVAAPRYPGGYNQQYRENARDVRQNTNDVRRDVRSNTRDTRQNARGNANDARRDYRNNR